MLAPDQGEDCSKGWTYHDEHEHGTYACLKKAQEEPLDVNRLVVMACARQGETNTPQYDDNRRHTFDWIPLSKDHRRISPSDEPQVKDRGRH